MKFLASIVAFVVAVSVTDGQSDDEAWIQYKSEQGKNYGLFFDGGVRDIIHKRIFLRRNAAIRRHNYGKFSTFKQAQNQFTDMRLSEMQRYLGVKPNAVPSNTVEEPPSIVEERPNVVEEPTNIIEIEKLQSPPNDLDHRNDVCMPEVKNQGSCGSCWAFAAIAPLEFAECKNTMSPTVLSDKQLVDCDKGNYGCNGGWYTNAWEYIKRVGGSAKETLYSPYNGARNFCRFRQTMIGAKVSSYAYVAPNNVMAMKNAIQNHGLLAVAVTVVDSFMFYGSGIYDDPDCDSREVNHAIVIVGWGTADGVEFWIGRNSWGPNWGEGGYIRIKLGVNKCKIESYAAYVLSE